MEFVHRLMTRRNQTDAALDEALQFGKFPEVKQEQTSRQAWENIDFTERISKKSIRSWVRLVTLMKVAGMQDLCASVIRHVAGKNQLQHEEQMAKLAKGLGIDLKTIRLGKGVKKETPHQAPHLARQLGKPLSRGKIGATSLDPASCQHTLLEAAGNGAKLWWKCNHCASRWERHHDATEVKKEEPSFPTVKTELPPRFMAQPVSTSRAQSSATSQASMDEDQFSEVDEMDGFSQSEEMRRINAGFMAMVTPTTDATGAFRPPVMTPAEAWVKLKCNPNNDKTVIDQFGVYLMNKGVLTWDDVFSFLEQSQARRT